MADSVRDITKIYSREILEIYNRLTHLENGRYYENSGAQMDGSLAHNISKLREDITNLLVKINDGSPSENERLREALKNNNI